MYEFHTDKKRYFDYQFQVTKNHIVPFLKGHLDFSKRLEVLEIGCGEAGVLKAFTEIGQQCVGIELWENRLVDARHFHKEAIEKKQIRFLSKNIYDVDLEKEIGHKFDLVILKDVIEHIHDQEKFMEILKAYLKPQGKVFFAFPPWQMPFGGHQQICRSKTSKIPFIHLFPTAIYKQVLKMGKENPKTIEELVEIKETGISIERFEKICKNLDYKTLVKQFYFINPIYELKFGLKPRKQIPLISHIPYIRNFLTTGVYYLVEPE